MNNRKLRTQITLHILLSWLLPVRSIYFLTVKCSSNSSTYGPNSDYHASLQSVLASLQASSSSSYFNSSTIGTTEKVQGFYQCRLDLSLDVCKLCVVNASDTAIRKCPNLKSASLLYDQCSLRYSNDTILSKLDTSSQLSIVNSQNIPEGERSRYFGYTREMLNESAYEVVDPRVRNFVAKQKNTYYNFTGTSYIYTLVQCTEDLSPANCSSCILKALRSLPQCCSLTIGGRIMLTSCFFRFEPNAFYNISGLPIAPAIIIPPPPDKKINVVAIVIPVSLVVVFLVIGCFWSARRRCRNRDEGNDMPDVDGLQYDLATIRAATENFSQEKKLGHGGFGDVYKGILRGGAEVAVKRLSSGSRQGGEEFKNEVMVVAQLQHKNLVQLVGFCAEGKEKILVYEFLPNKSLDFILFDVGKRRELGWDQRWKIIEGVVKGMLYLHEDSRLKIIHRDLKASNVLLDIHMNPKVADFGMARIFGVDQTQSNTGKIAGTLGYMAPEYAMHGQYSVKSDVYSFGVLLLEIITGRKCTHLDEDEDDLISYVWKHWRDQKVAEVVDASLEGRYPMNKAVRSLHIGLLCVQEDPAERPTMAAVILMINSKSVTMTAPRMPAFLESKRLRSVDWSNMDETSRLVSLPGCNNPKND